MKMGRSHRRSRGVSSIIATVILIAITLVAAVAVGGFVFGLMGQFTSGNAFSGYGNLMGGNSSSTTTTDTTTDTTTTANTVAVTPTSCTASGKTRSKCTLSIMNSGTSNADVVKNSCLIDLSGTLVGGTNPAKTIKPGKSATLTCTVNGAEPPSGTALSGYISDQSGALAFSGTWS